MISFWRSGDGLEFEMISFEVARSYIMMANVCDCCVKVDCTGVKDIGFSWSLLRLVWGVGAGGGGLSKVVTECCSRAVVRQLMKW